MTYSRTYLKCFWWNKFALAGIALMLVSIIFAIIAFFAYSPDNLVAEVLAACATVVFILGGRSARLTSNDTYEAYCRALDLLKAGKGPTLEKRLATADYCTEVGFKAAQRAFAKPKE